MKPLTDIYLFGSLSKIYENLKDFRVQLALDRSTPITEILRKLEIHPDAIQITMLNYRAVTKDSEVHPGDRLSLFPTEYPFFADWNDFRFS